MTKMISQDLIKNLPLRVAITNFCNLNCPFCSNEGMPQDYKNSYFIDSQLLGTLISLLAREGLSHLTLTGGEPTLHPHLEEIVFNAKKEGIHKVFLQTNGIALDNHFSNPSFIDELDKIGISLHAENYSKWNQATNGGLSQFNRLLANLDWLSSRGYNEKVEIKSVLHRGNSSIDEIASFLDFVSNYGFKFKFLNMESVEKSNLPLKEDFSSLRDRLLSVGAKSLPQDTSFRGQSSYNPVENFSYGNVKGNLINIGCGTNEACSSCYNTIEIFVTPEFELKPCHVDSKLISLRDEVFSGDASNLLRKIYDSREYLANLSSRGSFWGTNDF